MVIGLLGKKIGMTQVFKEDGTAVPVTLISAGPCYITQIKTPQNDGYAAIQIGYDDKREKSTNKPLKGHFKKANVSPKKVLREIRVDERELSKFKLGQELRVNIFTEGIKVNVTGTSKGRGFTGVVKRWGMHGADKTHGTHEYRRHTGSISASSDPSRVFKGKRMPGRYGNQTITVRNLTLFKIFEDKNLLLVKGAVPGPAKGYLFIKPAS